jgi:hypothetical protein
MPEKPILIVHPNDKTTSFLDKIKNHLIDKFGDQVHHYNIYPNATSHNDCLKRISAHPENGLIIFLGHGRSDKLYGSAGDLYHTSEFASPVAMIENPEAYYNNDNFINETNVKVFSGKKVFCLACNSNSKIAEYAIANGAQSFLGFGDIPTSPEEFREDGIQNVSGDIVKLMKTELNYIIKTSLEYSISKSHTFEQLHNIIQFIINQRITDTLINRVDVKERHLLTDYLYYLKKEVTVFGNKKIKLLT